MSNAGNREQYVAETFTGCQGAGDYRAYAEAQGYPFCEVFDWTSSAGDWTFLVSVDGHIWCPMSQENNYPRGPGFTRTIDSEQSFEGTLEEAQEYFVSLIA